MVLEEQIQTDTNNSLITYTLTNRQSSDSREIDVPARNVNSCNLPPQVEQERHKISYEKHFTSHSKPSAS